ncbi:hypothetical protein ACWEQC_21910 [Streptomyces shenzhenensis]
MSACRIDAKTPNQIVAQPATAESCQQDREGRNEAAQRGEANVQLGLAKIAAADGVC